ncbi:MAG: hypothetical protein ACYCQJ_11680 [Nitrososphaerales archaeon]
MVFIEDRGSVFDAPLEIVWKYLFDGEAHDKVHKSTRNSSFKPISKTSFFYSAERNFNGDWIPESIRQSVFPPLGMSTEWLEGPFAGSKMFYLYSPKGKNKTQIDVFGDFQSKTIPGDDLEPRVNKFLEREFRDDAPAVRDYAKHNKVGKKESAIFFKDVSGIFDAPLGVTWKYFFEGGQDHDNAHAKRSRNFRFKPVSEGVSKMSQERKKHNRWTGETIQMTNLAPLGYVFEMLKGSITGSQFLYIYMPKDGNKTQVDVYAYLKSQTIAKNRLKKEVRGDLALDFKEDAPALRAFRNKSI